MAALALTPLVAMGLGCSTAFDDKGRYAVRYPQGETGAEDCPSGNAPTRPHVYAPRHDPEPGRFKKTIHVPEEKLNGCRDVKEDLKFSEDRKTCMPTRDERPPNMERHLTFSVGQDVVRAELDETGCGVFNAVKAEEKLNRFLRRLERKGCITEMTAEQIHADYIDAFPKTFESTLALAYGFHPPVPPLGNEGEHGYIDLVSGMRVRVENVGWLPSAAIKVRPFFQGMGTSFFSVVRTSSGNLAFDAFLHQLGISSSDTQHTCGPPAEDAALGATPAPARSAGRIHCAAGAVELSVTTRAERAWRLIFPAKIQPPEKQDDLGLWHRPILVGASPRETGRLRARDILDGFTVIALQGVEGLGGGDLTAACAGNANICVEGDICTYAERNEGEGHYFPAGCEKTAPCGADPQRWPDLEVQCVIFPGRNMLIPEIQVQIQDTWTYVAVGTTLRNIADAHGYDTPQKPFRIEQARPSAPSIHRLFRGDHRPLGFEPGVCDAFDMPLLKGDKVSW